MTPCVVLAAPGGNPAPLAALVWALHGRGLRVERLELVLYASADRYLELEFLGGDRPLEQLRETLGAPELARVVPHLVHFADGRELEDDSEPGAALLFQDAIWQVARGLQSEPLPIVFALVGGRRRTLAVDMSTTFQLLGRPQDLLVDLRCRPKYADDPGSGFFFPGQTTAACVRVDHAGSAWVTAPEVQVEAVDVRVPRLRRALSETALATFGSALLAGEEALQRGPPAVLQIDLRGRMLRFGGAVVKLAPNHMIWFATLAFARQADRAGGWVDARETALLGRVTELCRALWFMEADELSDGYDFRSGALEKRHKRLNPIRSRLRARLKKKLEGHPRSQEIVPEKKVGKAPVERLAVAPKLISIEPPLSPDGVGA